jgi:hypothetical protein
VFHLSIALGLPITRSGPDMIMLNGMAIQFVVACTLADAFCGATPLLWTFSISIKSNVIRMAAIFVLMFPLNIARLEVGFVAFSHGVPWWLAHEFISGLTYFAFLLFIVKYNPDLSSALPLSLETEKNTP